MRGSTGARLPRLVALNILPSKPCLNLFFKIDKSTYHLLLTNRMFARQGESGLETEALVSRQSLEVVSLGVEFKYYPQAVQSWASYLTPLNLGFLEDELWER